jgi:hypothetical protein
MMPGKGFLFLKKLFPHLYTARDSKIGSAGVEQPLHLRPACIDKLFKFICFKHRLRLAQIQGVSLASPQF